MGFFDSKKTTKNLTTVNDYTTTNTDNRYAELDLAEGAVGVTGDVAGNLSITATDMGAIAAGQELSMAALDYGADSLELGYGLAGQTIDFSQDALAATVGQLSENQQDFYQMTTQALDSSLGAFNAANTSEAGQTSQQMMKYFAIVAALWLLSPVLQKMIKG
ncbi:hypothetical protein [uncultured Microbulbifer sp.]|uniref:hypothetical protein n=1 Tax=uncultured Microbulbifer sp. TaxID=348147 RepID=UPI00260CCB39|nr:hypothetical protein [uncultured Microbulbifer sp.]